MYAYLFLFLFTIGAGTAATVGIMNVNNKSHETSKALEDVRIMSLWETNIGDALEFAGPNGELVPPIGVSQTGSNAAQLPPTWIVAPRTNAYGKSIVYCPVSKNSGILPNYETKNISNQGKDYTANYITYKNKDYVISSNIELDKSIPRSSVLAFLISPGANEKPTCNDVIYNTDKGYFYLRGNNGIVRVVTPAHKINHGNEETPPIGDGRDLSAIFNDWSKTNGKDLIIDVNSKDYFNNTVSIAKFDSSSNIILKSVTGKKITVISNGSNLSTNGAKIFLDNVSLENLGSVSAENGSITTNNSILPKTIIGNANISIYGNTSFSGALSAISSTINLNGSKATFTTGGDAVYFKNSRINAYNGSTISIDVKPGKIPLSLIGNSDLYLESSTLNLQGSNGNSDAMILNDHTSRLSINSSNINFNSKSTYGIYTQGLLKIDNSNITPNSSTTVGVNIVDGSKAHIEGSNIGSSGKKFTYGVIIDSTSYTSGSSNNIYSGYTCVSGTAYNSSRYIPEKTIININWNCR